METIRIENRIGVRATAERLWEVLTDFGGWNRWNPHEIEVEGALGFGAPISLTERLPDLGERQVQAQLGEIAERLGDRFDTRVHIKLGAKKGQLTIDFATIADLKRILDELGDPGFS